MKKYARLKRNEYDHHINVKRGSAYLKVTAGIPAIDCA